MKNLFPLILILFCLSVSAQEYKSFSINNVSEEKVWPAVYKTLQALKLPKINVNKNTGVGETGFYNFTALMIKNRCRLRFEYKAETLTVTIFGRQYLSEKGWVDNMLPMTKKQASKLLDPIENRLSSLSNTELAASTQTAATATQQPLTSNTKKAGIYDDFAIIKTDDPELELLAIHKEHQILGFNLYEDQKTVRSLVFLENENADAVTMLFTEEGFPLSMITPGYIIEIAGEGSTRLHLALFDLEGNFIREGIIPWEKPEPTGMIFTGEEQGHGPFPGTETVMIEGGDLAEYLGYASTALKVVSCAALVGSGAGIPIAALTCGSALLDLTVRTLPRENIFYDELALLSEAASLIQLKDPLKGIKLVSRINELEKLDRSEKLITGLKNAITGGWNLYNKHFPPGKIQITGPAVLYATYEENTNKSAIYFAKSSSPDIPITWDLQGSDAVTIDNSNRIKLDRPGYTTLVLSVRDVTVPEKFTIKASQVISGKEISALKEVELNLPKAVLKMSGEKKKMLSLKKFQMRTTHVFTVSSSYPDMPINFSMPETEGVRYTATPNNEGLMVVNLIVEKPVNTTFALTASQIIDGKEITAKKEYVIQSPEYFYLPDCVDLQKAGLLTESQYGQCVEDLNRCADQINGEGNVPVLMSESYLKNLPPKNKNFLMLADGTFRDYVRPASCMDAWYGLDDRQTIILLAHEAMGKIKINDGKIKTLQKAAEMTLKESQNFNDPRVLKIAADINLLEDASDRIRDEYGEKISKIAEKGTIRFSFTQTDRSSCYRAQGVYVSGAHWENSWLTILMRYEIEPKQCREELEYGAIFEGKGIGTVTCIYYGQDDKEISKGAIPNFSGKFQAAINFPEFEQIERIDFFKSEPGGIWKESN